MGNVRRARRSLGEDRRRMGRVGGVERSPEIPCIVHFRPRTGTKTGAGQQHTTQVDQDLEPRTAGSETTFMSAVIVVKFLS